MDAQLRLLTAGSANGRSNGKSNGKSNAESNAESNADRTTTSAAGRAAARDAARRGPRRGAAARPSLPEHHEPVEAPASWRIDDTTREVGRSGLALARAALRQARPAPSTDAALALVDGLEVTAPLAAVHATATAA
jgi:hypothetical protein